MKSLFRTILHLAVLLAVCAGLTTCNRGDGPGRVRSHRVTIGFAMDSLVVERWLRDRDVFMNRVHELGAEVLLQVANEDSDVQAQQIEWLVSRKVDAIVVVANDSIRIGPAILAARAAGIPVIAYDRLAENAGVDLYVSFDNLKVGALIAGVLQDHLKSGRIMIINGSRRDNNAHLYSQGIHQVLADNLASGRYRLVREVWLENWSNEEATQAVEAALNAPEAVRSGLYPEAILCANDFLAEAAIKVLAEHRLAGRVLVVGHDAELSACQRVVEGTQLATIYKPIPRLATLGAEMAVRLARHEPLPPTRTMNDGSQEVPTLLLDVLAVTRANMLDTVIKDGFHRFEDVYRHIPVERRPKL
jgi:D-xylose transport system substrate-binding protein